MRRPTILPTLLMDAVLAFVISAVLCLAKYVGSLLGWCVRPTWLYDFLGGALGVFVLLSVYNTLHLALGRRGADKNFRDKHLK